MIAVNDSLRLQPELVLDHGNLSEESAGVGLGLYGPALMHQDRPGTDGGVVMAWRQEFSGGRYDVWASFAAEEPRPMALTLDGRLVTERALSDTSGGWGPSHQTWMFQQRLEIEPGSHDVSLECAGPPPHVAALAFVPVEDGTEPPVADVETAASILARHASEVPGIGTGLDDPLRSLIHAIRAALNAGAGREELDRVFDGLAAAVEADITNPQIRLGFGGPLNGQRVRQSIFLQLKQLMQFDALVETGAFNGTTTEWFATLGLPVFSCEVMPAQFYFAAQRLANYSNATLLLADSRSFLRRYFADMHRYRRPAFYLDAHWQDDLPLPEEIDIIADHCEDFAIVVDDFKSPFHGYDYDRYANGNELTLEFVLPRLKTRRKLAYLFPSLGPSSETGARRGTLFVVPEETYQREVKALRSLLRAA